MIAVGQPREQFRELRPDARQARQRREQRIEQGRAHLRTASVGQRPGAREDRARAHDSLAIDHQKCICEGEPVAQLLHIHMRLDPIADLGRTGEIGGQVRGDQAGGRVLAERGLIAERDIGERDQEPAVREAARIGVFLRDAQADHEAAFGIAAIEQRPDRFEKRTGAEQRFESGRRIGLTHDSQHSRIA